MLKPTTENTPTNVLFRQLKCDLNFTNAQLAEACGVSVHTVAAWMKTPTCNSYRVVPRSIILLLGMLAARERRITVPLTETGGPA